MRRNSDREVRELRRRVLAGNAEDAGDVTALAAAMTRSGDLSRQLGTAQIVRALARRLFWIDVRRLADAIESTSDSSVERTFGQGSLAWENLPERLRSACEQTGRLSTPDGWREILTFGPFAAGASRAVSANELDLARRVFVGVIEAEARRRRRQPNMPEHGLRVVWDEPVDHYPHFVVEPGTTGTVVQSDGREDPAIVVRVDQIIDGAEEWNNEVHWPQYDLDVFHTEVRALEE